MDIFFLYLEFKAIYIKLGCDYKAAIQKSFIVCFCDIVRVDVVCLTVVTYKRQKLEAVLFHPRPKAEHGHTGVLDEVLIRVRVRKQHR